MQCAHCSTPVPDDARFCHSCGSQVSDAEGQARASASLDLSSFQHMEKLLKEDTEGEFEIQGMLGRGGMAVVFLAIETKLGRKVAIKVLPPELTFGHGVDRFMREAKTAAALDHPHIIPIYRIGSGKKLFWYAMKFLEGRSLDDLMKEKGKLPVDDAIPILEQVGGLRRDDAHRRAVRHAASAQVRRAAVRQRVAEPRRSADRGCEPNCELLHQGLPVLAARSTSPTAATRTQPQPVRAAWAVAGGLPYKPRECDLSP